MCISITVTRIASQMKNVSAGYVEVFATAIHLVLQDKYAKIEYARSDVAVIFHVNHLKHALMENVKVVII